jgi:hypothetical protein
MRTTDSIAKEMKALWLRNSTTFGELLIQFKCKGFLLSRRDRPWLADR